MSFWSWIRGDLPPSDPSVNPGDPNGVEYDGEETFSRSLPYPAPSAWSGWPAEWATPNWGSTQMDLSRLVDIAWACADLNSRVLAGFPPYRLRNGQIIESPSWLTNPDPSIYSSWYEFMRQLVWDFLVSGEAFVLSMATGGDGYPLRFRTVPPWLVNVEMRNGSREYSLGGVGGQNVTDEILHVRYSSNTADAHGHGPLECAGARMTSVGLLQRYANRLIETGGTPHYWVQVERRLDQKDADDLLNQWVQSRARRIGEPALLSGGAELKNLQSMSAKDMALVELQQLNESRIAVLMGTPPFLVGLPGGGDSLTYSNVSSLFDFHDRSSLRPMATAVMQALSGWALPRGQSIELNRDEYSRPGMLERAQAWKVFQEMGAVDGQYVAEAERFYGAPSASALTGVTEMPQQPAASPVPINNSEVQ